jgi:hypothetical protein
MIPWLGKLALIIWRMATSPARSATVTGSKAPPCDLSRAAIAERKNGRMAVPERVASSSTKAEKSTGAHRGPFKLGATCAGLLERRGLGNGETGFRRPRSCYPKRRRRRVFWTRRHEPSCPKEVAARIDVTDNPAVTETRIPEETP